MGQPKKLEQTKRLTGPVRSDTESQVTEEILNNRRTWQSAIEELVDRRYQSIELALSAVAQQVFVRLGMTPTKEQLEFVLLVLETDPIAADEIEKLVR